MNRIALYAASLFIALPLCVPGFAQTSVPPNTGTAFKDTSILRAPAGARVAILEFEDLECPACSHAFPIIRAAAEHYKIPLLHHDFPLKMHIWSLDAAITARYLQDKVSFQAAEDYRRAVFASQSAIASKEDLQNFTRRYFQSHGRAMPFVIDPTGQFAREVHADYELGERLGLTQTPTVFVVMPKRWIQVTDINQLYQAIDTALAETPAPEAHNNLRRPAKAKR